MIKDLKLKISLTPSAVPPPATSFTLISPFITRCRRSNPNSKSSIKSNLLMTSNKRNSKRDNPMEEETVKSLEKLKQLITETQDEVMNHVKNGVITVGDINYTTDLNTKVSTFTKELKSFLISIEEICRKHPLFIIIISLML